MERRISSAYAISDADFAKVLADFQFSQDQVERLKRDYDQHAVQVAVNEHNHFLSCRQAGSSEEKPLGLYEQCDRANEEAVFLDLGRRIQLVQEKNKKLQPNQQTDGRFVHRGFHAKPHGCLYGKLSVTDPASRPEWTRHGIFAEQRDFLTWTRFSNGTGLIQADYQTEPRGMAIKVLGVDGARASLYGHTYEATTQDFLMTNKPMATTPTPMAFIEFAEATANGKIALVDFIAHNNWIIPILSNLKLHKSWIPNVGDIQYWSGVPISMGKTEDGRRVPVKFMAVPCEGAPYQNDSDVIASQTELQRLGHLVGDHSQDNYGRAWLKKLAGKYDICYDIKFQIQTDVDKTSVEDGLNEWTEQDSPPVTVARLVMPKQDFDQRDRDALCERMRFNPWNALDEHTPMSDTNQARGVVYLSSATHREGKDWTGAPTTLEPSVAEHPLHDRAP